ncbi:OmpA family protein [Verrucomicrobiales bacterium BCK34]|nr:OmpA family protein [Verrucomicrobiales bacterium BCK34]
MNKTNLITFLSIVIAGGIGSFIYITKKADRVEVPPATNETKHRVIEEEPDDELTPAKATPKVAEKTKEPAPAEPKAQPAKPKPKATPDTPAKVLSALSDAIAAKNFEAFAANLKPGAISEAIKPQVKALVESPDYDLDSEKPFIEISKSPKSLRWALNFAPKTGDAKKQLYTDIAEGEAEGSLEIDKVSLPLEAAVAGTEDTNGTPAEASPADKADSLAVAHAFSKAVVKRDFKSARALSDPATVTDERVAALMIAIEEGKFALKEERPLVVTLSREDITWVLTRVQSDQSASEFALELGQIDENWKVNGLTFSKVLSALSEQAGGGQVAYSPIVEDPAGGDSLVLYFEFDDADLTPRAARQLSIVADILSQGEDRVMRINGHADAKGSDAYNSKLSDGRADAIRKALIGMGVAPNQIVTEAYGESQPRRPNFNADGTDNPSGRSHNRRAEVFLDF